MVRYVRWCFNCGGDGSEIQEDLLAILKFTWLVLGSSIINLNHHRLDFAPVETTWSGNSDWKQPGLREKDL